MKDQELRSLLERLEKWREDRYLTYEKQRECLLGNVLEEITEFVRANSVYERIDALCDIAVYVMNSQRIGFTPDIPTPIIPDNSVEATHAYLVKSSTDRSDEALQNNYTRFLLETTTTYVAGNVRWAKYNPEFYAGSITVDESVLRAMLHAVAVGLKLYTTKSIYECLEETLKEIESRTGIWSDERRKFVKDIGFYTREQLLEWLQEAYEFNGKWVIQEKDEWFVCKKELDSDENEYRFKKWYKADYGVYNAY